MTARGKTSLCGCCPMPARLLADAVADTHAWCGAAGAFPFIAEWPAMPARAAGALQYSRFNRTLRGKARAGRKLSLHPEA